MDKLKAVGPDDHVLGGDDARVTLLEYGDYECPFCARAHPVVSEVRRRMRGAVRYVFRHFPITQLHPHALVAAQAAEAAGAQGRFWAMHGMLLAHQHALELADLVIYARAQGLEVRRFLREVQGQVYLPKVKDDLRSGVRSGVHATPTFFIDGRIFDKRWSGDMLAKALDAAMHKGGPAATR